MAKVYCIDGEMVLAESAELPVTDLAVVRGYGVFDFFRTYGGRPVQIERNLERLRRSAEALEIPVPWSDATLSELVHATLARNVFSEATIRMVITGGDSPNFITPAGRPRLLIYIEPLHPQPTHWYTDGVAVITVHEDRYLPRAKSLLYTQAILAQKRASAVGAVEALYVDRQHHVAEGTTTNVFAFLPNGEVITPKDNLLLGITRGRVLEVLATRYTVHETDLPLSTLLTADEVVITAANKQVVPVVKIDETVIHGGHVGEHARWLMTAFADYIAQQVSVRDKEEPARSAS